MSKKEKLYARIVANIPHTQHLLRSDIESELDDVADIVLTIDDGRAVFRLGGAPGMIANSFETKISWSEKQAYRMKVKPHKYLREKVKETVKLASDRTWGEHDDTYGFKQDKKLYNRVREMMVDDMLRAFVTDRVREMFKEFNNGL